MGGYVKASALAPIRDCVASSGGRIARVLRAAHLPMALLDRPDLVLPLSDQYAVLEAAARETGSAAFGAEMGAAARIRMLGAYGEAVVTAPTLGTAIKRAGSLLNGMMQTDTDLVLLPLGSAVKWSMVFHTPGREGRYQNELLATGYQLDLLRAFLGASWTPHCIHFRASDGHHRRGLERAFRAPVRATDDLPGIVLGREALAACAPFAIRSDGAKDGDADMPGLSDAVTAARASIRLELLDGWPVIDRVAARVGLSRRSFQRGLADAGTNFGQVLAEELLREARALLAARIPVGEVADRLGYSDPAHFTRAFRRWTGDPPSRHLAES